MLNLIGMRQKPEPLRHMIQINPACLLRIILCYVIVNRKTGADTVAVRTDVSGYSDAVSVTDHLIKQGNHHPDPPNR